MSRQINYDPIPVEVKPDKTVLKHHRGVFFDLVSYSWSNRSERG